VSLSARPATSAPIRRPSRSCRSNWCPVTTAVLARATPGRVRARGSEASSTTSRCWSARAASAAMTGAPTSTGALPAGRRCSSAHSARPAAASVSGRSRRRRRRRRRARIPHWPMTWPRRCSGGSTVDRAYPDLAGPIAQLARAPRLQRGGHRFEPCWDHRAKVQVRSQICVMGSWLNRLPIMILSTFCQRASWRVRRLLAWPWVCALPRAPLLSRRSVQVLRRPPGKPRSARTRPPPTGAGEGRNRTSAQSPRALPC
jgi:hypothetical protein